MEIEVTEMQYKAVKLYLDSEHPKNMKEIALELGVSYSRVINILNNLLIKTRSATKKELLIKAKDIKWVLKK